jgi:benzoyl-CoA 2,3-dioxygenase component B
MQQTQKVSGGRDVEMELDAPDGHGGIVKTKIPARNAMNEITRQGYIHDCENGIRRWNTLVEKAGFAFRFKLPSERFRRSIGLWVEGAYDPDGVAISKDAFTQRQDEWLPSAADKAFVQSLMRPVLEPGKIAGWLAAPDRGINHLPVEYEYVTL